MARTGETYIEKDTRQAHIVVHVFSKPDKQDVVKLMRLSDRLIFELWQDEFEDEFTARASSDGLWGDYQAP